MHKIARALGALSVLAVLVFAPAAHADPTVGNSCYWVDSSVQVDGEIIAQPDPDFYGCQRLVSPFDVNTSQWFYDPATDPLGCFTWGRDSRGFCG